MTKLLIPIFIASIGVLHAQDDDVGPLQSLVPPVKLEIAKEIVGEGDKRKSGVRLTNEGDKNIKAFVLTIFFLDGEAKSKKTFPFLDPDSVVSAPFSWRKENRWS